MKKFIFLQPMVASVLFVLSVPLTVYAEDPTPTDEIVLGADGPFSGKAANYGKAVAAGHQIYFDQINAKGGIHGRKIRYLTSDSNYDPRNALENIKKFVEKDHVFAIVGGNGTPTTAAYLPYLMSNSVPIFFPQTGAAHLRDPHAIHSFTLTVGYQEQAKILADYAVTKLGLKKIGIFMQNDSFGTTGQIGVSQGLDKHDLHATVVGTYERATLDVSQAVEKISKENPEAIYLAGIAPPSIDFIQQYRKKGLDPVFLAPAPVGVYELIKALKKDANRIYVFEEVPLLNDRSTPIVAEFLEAAKTAKKDNPDSLMFQGYISARIFGEALEKAGPNASRQAVEKAVSDMHGKNLGGLPLDFDPRTRQLLKTGWLTKVEKGEYAVIKE